MSSKELSELIHQSVGDAFSLNREEFFNKFHALTTSLNSKTQNQSKDIEQSLFEYTAFVSEMNCIAMSKTLSAMGILNISPSDE